MTQSQVPALRRLLPVAVVLVILGLAVYLVVGHASDLADAWRRMGPGVVVGSGLLAVAGTASVERIWVSLLAGSGARVESRAAVSVFFVSQFGKYLPGSVWPVVAQMELGRRIGVARRVMLSSNILMLAIVGVTGLVTGAALLPWSQPEGLRRYAWAYLFLVPLLACLHPRTIPALLDLAFRLARRPPLGATFSGGSIVRACAWGFVMWALLGAHVAVMTAALGGQGIHGVVASVGGMGLAFAAGLLVPLTPAGAGVRDAILVLTLTPQVGASGALAIALASRVLMLVSDVVLAGAAGLWGRSALREMSLSGR